jgi:pyruvoyl-dependent arginine decarboxylase (PvlArgDC)
MKKVERYTPKTDNEWGHKLYCVKWDVRSRKAGEYIASGLGWYQKEDKSGVLVEHQSSGFSKESVEKDLKLKIEKSLTDLCKFRNIPFDKSNMNMSYSIGKVADKSCCVLSIAVFQAQGWSKPFGFGI